jgi:hypothetical protein
MPVINDIEATGATSPAPGPCDWELDTTCIPGWETDYTNAQRSRAISWATFVLDALTGRQFAQCPVTVRPCGPSCGLFQGYQTFPVGAPAPGVPGTWMAPYVAGGIWRNCVCPGGCDCAPACRIDLGVPVASVTEVKVDGVVLDPAAYQLVGPWLTRVDGGDCWPSCQDPSVPDTEPGTFSVTFRPGRTLPVAGQIAGGALAGEFIKACAGAACGLPPQIAALTRQGVDVEFVDPSEALSSGRTGIRDVDLFIEAVNPSGLRRRARVMSPDVPAHPVVYG